MNTHQVFWKRSGYVEIEGRDGRMYRYGGSHDGLDFRFEGSKVGNIITSQFTVGILGLSSETINFLTVWDPAVSLSKKRRIRVFAGYDFQNLSNPIFDGIIVEAIPSNPPEMWLNFKCMFLPEIKDIEEKVVLEPKSEVAKEIAYMFGCKCRWESEKSNGDELIKFDFNDSPSNLFSRFCNAYKLASYRENDIIHITDASKYRSTPHNASVINTRSGLLGLGNVTVKGALIKRRLDDSSSIFSWVKLESLIIPKANGYYNVLSKKHVGQFRGDAWYTELDTLRAY